MNVMSTKTSQQESSGPKKSQSNANGRAAAGACKLEADEPRVAMACWANTTLD